MPPFRVVKLGGTTVGDPSHWPRIAEICRGHLRDGARPVLVCSAFSGVTDGLTALLDALEAGTDATAPMDRLAARHAEMARDLGVEDGGLVELDALSEIVARGTAPDPATRAQVLASGERLSSRLGVRALRAMGVDADWVDVRSVLRATSDGLEPADYLSAECEHAPCRDTQRTLAERGEGVLVTQGFTAANPRGETVVLGRGGSDTSAAYLASLLEADRLEIWTDVPGAFTTNPRLVDDARLLPRVSLDEVATMAALGAKVLHPRSLGPSRRFGVPLEIRWTAHPELPQGTRIDNDPRPGIKAIASRKQLAEFVVERDPAWQPIGFLAEFAGCFSQHGVSIDLLSSSAGSIRATVDRTAVPHLDQVTGTLVEHLGRTNRVSVNDEVGSVSFVGHGVSREADAVGAAVDGLPPEALHFVSHCADDLHVTYIVDERSVDDLVRDAHELLFEVQPDALGPSWRALTSLPPRRPPRPVPLLLEGATA